MNSFCIITNYEKDYNLETTNLVKDYLMSKNKKCVIVDSISEELGYQYTDINSIPPGTECAIVLGGDGTIIRAANDLRSRSIPILGINLGTLGFLTEIEKVNINSALQSLIDDEFCVDHRMMLSGRIIIDEELDSERQAMNDIVITRRDFSKIISVTIYVNKEYVDTYRGDGVIISTPTGSTGYNLSAGGPIVLPNTKSIVITPICPHTFMNRSIIVSDEDEITVIIGETKKNQYEKAIVTLDGNQGIELQKGDSVVIKKTEEEIKLLKIYDTSFFEVLRNKFMKKGVGYESWKTNEDN
ncbi:NAD(+)/NADH kinase [Anaeromicropila herbilytica]|uniref:NAD kinase n=1 Tax=Anaeromicropila herbilytica TaxID=2785025 RepID=A0A7R7EKS8_9FIRM|nr:NAD(+)/NADH kinase [Anaeromicropila herbilytica]BCN30406.1 NAD kinase [Anaeromicropila herbilytica]